MRTAVVISFAMLLMVAAGSQGQQENQNASGLHTLTVVVENVNQEGGNIGVLVFNSTKGWPENRFVAFRDVVVPAHPGTVTVTIPGLPAGDYAVAIAHDLNQNHKLDRNLFGAPKEQWEMSNNPHATIKPPPFSAQVFAGRRSGDSHQNEVRTSGVA